MLGLTCVFRYMFNVLGFSSSQGTRASHTCTKRTKLKYDHFCLCKLRVVALCIVNQSEHEECCRIAFNGEL